ncbi:MAG: transcription termination factor NusA [Bacilli bacterium]|nr:transcription termination factor NusA [Bacilli bacterium]
MPKKKVEEQREPFSVLVDQVAQSNSVSRDAVLLALKDAIRRAYIKQVLQGGDDAKVDVIIEEEPLKITIAYTRTVMKEDDITDDYLEISIDDANKGLKKAKYKAGDEFTEFAEASEMKKSVAMAVQNILRSNLREYEREALYEAYKDRIGEIITGTVEKCDDHGMTVNIGRTVVELGRKDMIGDEDYHQGDVVKLYIQEVRSSNPNAKRRGNQIEVTRASEGFLKRLFEEEIQEVYEGTVIIKNIAREAGIRSKVAVYSNHDDIDPQGACIGQGGNRIQSIVAQLGNSKDKEKIDVIVYSPNIGLFIANSMRPSDVVGVEIIDEEERKASVIIEDEKLSLAIGKKGANARLANRLTGWDIQIIPLSEATRDGIIYTPYATLVAQAEEEKARREKEEYARKSQAEALRRIQEEKQAPKEEPVVSAPKATEPTPAPVETPVEETKKEEVKVAEPIQVKTSTTLENLEAELAAEKQKKAAAPKAKKKEKKVEEEVKPVTPITPAVNAMPIYSEEELAEIESEEENPYDEYDDMDLDDYDEYYDDEN